MAGVDCPITVQLGGELSLSLLARVKTRRLSFWLIFSRFASSNLLQRAPTSSRRSAAVATLAPHTDGTLGGPDLSRESKSRRQERTNFRLRWTAAPTPSSTLETSTTSMTFLWLLTSKKLSQLRTVGSNLRYCSFSFHYFFLARRSFVVSFPFGPFVSFLFFFASAPHQH